jgi:hypothetical protein
MFKKPVVEVKKEKAPIDFGLMAKLFKKPAVEVETKKVDISVISPDVFSPHMSDVDE